MAQKKVKGSGVVLNDENIVHISVRITCRINRISNQIQLQ